MAVAVKNTPEAPSKRAFDSLPLASIAGTLYLVLCLAAVFAGLPKVWAVAVTPWLAEALNSFVDQALLGVAMLAAAIGLIYLGVRMAGSNPVKGLRAGVFAGFVGLLLIAFITEGIGFLLDNWFYTNDWFGGSGYLVGGAVTGALGIALLVLAGRGLFQPGVQRFIVQAEEQGWFSACSYKRSQGHRVRFGTTLAIIVLGLCGVYKLASAHGVLAAAPTNWEAPVPFTGLATVTSQTVGDNEDLSKLLGNDPDATYKLGRYELRDNNARFAASHVKVDTVGAAADLKPDQVVTRARFEKAKEDVKNMAQPSEKPLAQPTEKSLVPATGTVDYFSVPLLPEIRFTLPLLVFALTLWLGWRIVNMPAFADFLIATEAELNKVSWTTRARLVQDTIVVLVTVVLLAVFLLVADITWSKLLNAVGVIQAGKGKTPQSEINKELNW